MKTTDQGSHSQGNIILQHFQHFSRTKLPFSRTKYTSFKRNKSRSSEKAEHIYSMYDILLKFFYGTASFSPLLAVCSIHFYINVGKHGISLLLMVPLLFSITTDVFLSRRNFYSQAFKDLFHRQYFVQDISWLYKIPGHFQD
jgi:hypothetical protein